MFGLVEQTIAHFGYSKTATLVQQQDFQNDMLLSMNSFANCNDMDGHTKP
jgi:hypothetical protein